MTSASTGFNSPPARIDGAPLAHRTNNLVAVRVTPVWLGQSASRVNFAGDLRETSAAL